MKGTIDKSRTPVIIGAAQYTQRRDIAAPLDPLGLIIKSGRNALRDTGSALKLPEIIDAVYVVSIWGWSYKDAPARLSASLGLKPSYKLYSNTGGNVPQYLVNKAARAIARGESRAVLITGGESEYSLRRAKRQGLALNWPEKETPEYFEGEKIYYMNEIERHYGIVLPVDAYALIETALRHASGWDHGEHFSRMGKLLERYSRISSNNPYSWTDEYFTADEISSVTAENRYLIYPFVKRFVSGISVDQSAAVIITNEEVADRLGIPAEHRVYPMGGADIENIFYLTQRPKFYDSPPLKAAATLSLEQAGLSLDDIRAFDIYSCFPCMIEIARREIGIPDNDTRDITVTGGLPFFGGPFNSYSLHAVVSAAQLIRDNPEWKIMVQANGGINAKQSIGIYGSKPSTIQWTDRDDSAVKNSILENQMPEPVIKAEGKFTVEGYAISFDRQGKPEKCVAAGRLETGARAIGFIIADNNIFNNFEKFDLVGMTGDVSFDAEKGYNFIILKA
jgi:acetyl-CoA C-acetyltransferase